MVQVARRRAPLGELVAGVTSRSADTQTLLSPSTTKRKAVTDVCISWGVVLLIGVLIQALVNHVGEGGANGALANELPIYIIWFVCALVYRFGRFRSAFVPSSVSSTEGATCLRDGDEKKKADIHNGNAETKDNHEVQQGDVEDQDPPPDQRKLDPSLVPKSRMCYLDNLKTFLIFIVFTGHAADGLGVLIKNDVNVTEEQAVGLFSINVLVEVLFQGCIMPLFFFMSAVNIPRSYNHSVGNPAKFMANKTKRLFIPATVTALVIIPLEGFGWDLLENGWKANPFRHPPRPKHTWYILWLLILCWVYSTLRQAMAVDQAKNAEAGTAEDPTQVHKVETTTDTTSSSALQPFPSFFQRYILVGFLGCGWAMLVIVLAIDAPYFSGTFWGVPINIGSYTCDLIFFAAGILAAQNNWLPGAGPPGAPQKSMEQLIGMPMWRLRVQAFVESLVVVYLRMMKPDPENRIWYGMVMHGIAGIYCVDMSVVVLQFFQQCLNFHNMFTMFMGGGAYVAYLIHPALLSHLTALFLYVYTKYNGPVLNDDGSVATDRMLHEQWHIALAWCFVQVSGHLTLWPLCFFLQQKLVTLGYL